MQIREAMPRYTLTSTAQNLGTGPIIIQSDIPFQYQYTIVTTGSTPVDANYVTGNLGGEFDIIVHNSTTKDFYARRSDDDTGITVTLNVSPA